MRKLVFLVCFIPAFASAVAFGEPDPAPGSGGAPPAAAVAPASARDACVAAMNADPMFANAIIKIANEQTAATHAQAAERVATNERHVILAYAAMWVIAALFVLFLWRRQQGLQGEIARLRRDLEAATKEAAK